MTSFTERWLPVYEWEGLYEVSNWGRVKSLARWRKIYHGGKWLAKERIRKLRLNAHGYLIVDLRRDGRRSSKNVHGLVLTAFVGPSPEGLECCHGDRNKTNNCLLNLRWDTKSNNQADRILHGTSNRGERNGVSKLTAEKVKAIRARCARGETQPSIAADFGISRVTVSHIHLRKTWAHV